MDLKEYVFVFDLDDTLISETEYLISGINYVEKYLSKTYNLNFENKIIEARNAGIDDLWGWCCKTLELPIETKESLIWLYRLHKPQISMPLKVQTLINYLMNKNIKIAIITDGRSITQRLKIMEIGLDNIPIFISQEYQSPKPELKRFRLLQDLLPNMNYIYIGDNPSKDFIGPNKLGWLTIGADWISPRIYNKYNNYNKNKNSQPKFWIKDPLEIPKIIYNSIY